MTSKNKIICVHDTKNNETIWKVEYTNHDIKWIPRTQARKQIHESCSDPLYIIEKLGARIRPAGKHKSLTDPKVVCRVVKWKGFKKPSLVSEHNISKAHVV